MTTQQTTAAAAAATAQAVPETEVLRLLQVRGSVRDFKPDPIPDAWLDALLAAGQRAPTSSNIQAYSIVVVKNPATKARLSELANNQQHIIDCPVFLALCADITRPQLAARMHGTKYLGHTFEKGLVASIDAALVGMTITLAADSLGLGSVMIGAMRNRPLEVHDLLGLPRGAYVVFGMCLGFPRTPPVPKPRQPLETVVHRERYDGSRAREGLEVYDRELAAYYIGQGRETPDQAWTQVVAEKFSKPMRTRLRQELHEMGFDLE